MIKFSFLEKTFYNTEFDYPMLPDDLVEVTADQHMQLLNALNSGSVIFSDLTISTPKPSPFHTWDEGNLRWIDPRTDEEKQAAYTASLPSLNRRQFMRTLVLSGIDPDTIEPLIQTIENETTRKLALVDWKESTDFWRTDETLLLIAGMLGLTEEQINTMWELGLTF